MNERLYEMLDRANQGRRVRTVCQGTVENMIRSIREYDEDDCLVAHGGSVPLAYRYPATTTLVLVARVDGRLYAGVSTPDALATSPGRAWACLQPWGKGKPETVLAKLREWTGQPNVVEIQ